jgi:hypothetical protein
MGAGGSIPGGKVAGAFHLVPRLKEHWGYAFTPQHPQCFILYLSTGITLSFRCFGLIGYHQANSTFTVHLTVITTHRSMPTKWIYALTAVRFIQFVLAVLLYYFFRCDLSLCKIFLRLFLQVSQVFFKEGCLKNTCSNGLLINITVHCINRTLTSIN